MLGYIVRRLLLGIPTVLGVLFILFTLFFWIARPEHIAQKVLGDKATQEQIDEWIEQRGYALPKFYNPEKEGLEQFTQTRFVSYFNRMLTFNFGTSDSDNEPIVTKLKRGAPVSLSISIPIFLMSLFMAVSTSLLIALFRNTYVDKYLLFLCVVGMSVVYFLYIIGGQVLFGFVLKWAPMSGFNFSYFIHFAWLPIVIGVIAGVSNDIRLYRTVMINEINQDYIRTARAKGLSDRRILFVHLLKNAMIPILTGLVMAIPFLFTGSLLLESFMGIPGLGRMTVQAIQNNDFSTISAMVYISALLYILGNILTDISYTLVDPRVRLK